MEWIRFAFYKRRKTKNRKHTHYCWIISFWSSCVVCLMCVSIGLFFVFLKFIVCILIWIYLLIEIVFKILYRMYIFLNFFCLWVRGCVYFCLVHFFSEFLIYIENLFITMYACFRIHMFVLGSTKYWFYFIVFLP